MVSNIFISYRRDDSGGYAGRLSEALSHHSELKIFRDIDTIPAGVDFVRTIEQAISSSYVLLVIIGKTWLTCTNEHGNRRLDSSDDLVRTEIEIALNSNIRVIPVLVQGAPMPRETDLPDVIKSLARRHAIELSEAHWSHDVALLAEILTRETLKGSIEKSAVKAADGTLLINAATEPITGQGCIGIFMFTIGLLTGLLVLYGGIATYDTRVGGSGLLLVVLGGIGLWFILGSLIAILAIFSDAFNREQWRVGPNILEVRWTKRYGRRWESYTFHGAKLKVSGDTVSVSDENHERSLQYFPVKIRSKERANAFAELLSEHTGWPVD
ncbi:MAG: toll/interleukin-1 receptor domain-containing protein [Acidobacteriota bacterium]|nr:toll/interleukin-1 receptor domain-containing protein [Acidobacteriota bacterium]